MSQEKITINREDVFKSLKWEEGTDENGILSYNKTKNDLTERQFIKLRQKDDEISFSWTKQSLETGESSLLFHFKLKGDIVSESSPELESKEHFETLLLNVSNTIRLMDIKPSFQFTGYKNNKTPSVSKVKI